MNTLTVTDDGMVAITKMSGERGRLTKRSVFGRSQFKIELGSQLGKTINWRKNISFSVVNSERLCVLTKAGVLKHLDIGKSDWS